MDHLKRHAATHTGEKPSPHHVIGGGEVAAELFEEDGDGNGYSGEEGKYI
jgi:hypothetical protein